MPPYAHGPCAGAITRSTSNLVPHYSSTLPEFVYMMATWRPESKKGLQALTCKPLSVLVGLP